MKKALLLTIVPMLMTTCFHTVSFAQKVVQIGSTEIVLQSPLKVNTAETEMKSCHTSHYSEMFIGVGLTVNDNNEKYMLIYYGNSYEIQVGFRDVYRKGRSFFAAGSYINLSFDSYKLDKAYLHNPLVVSDDIGTIHKEYYRSSNLTAGLFARFYLNEALFLDLGPYGEYAYNKKYKVFITLLGDSGESKIKYRDGRSFNPFNAGLQCSLGFNGFSVYAKYRLTNCFNHDNIELEVPRLNIGIQFEI